MYNLKVDKEEATHVRALPNSSGLLAPKSDLALKNKSGLSVGPGVGGLLGSKLSMASHGLRHNTLILKIEAAVGENTCKYKKVDEVFLKKRKLEENSIGPWSMYAYCLGLILCLGCSNAWNSALVYGYGAVIVSAMLAGLAYTALIVIVAEMMTMLPFNGGMATFARAAFGPYWGYIIGSSEAWEYTLFGAQAVWQSGLVLATAANIADLNYAPLFWLLTVGLVFALQMAGTRWIMRFIGLTLTINILAMFILVIPSLPSLNVWQNTLFPAQNLQGIAPNVVNATDVVTLMFPFGSNGIFQTIPTLMWTFMGIEATPLCCEEAVDFVANGPRVALKAQGTMWFSVIVIMVIVPLLAPGLSNGGLDPLVQTFCSTYNIQAGSIAYNALYCTLFLPNLMLAISCYSFACSRQIYGLSHVGYYSDKLSIVSKTKVPIGAIIETLILFMLVALILQYEASGVVLLALLNGSLLYGLFAYTATGFAYIKLRIFIPHVNRPFNPGYWVGMISALFLISICIACMVQLFSTDVFRETLLVCLGKLALQFTEFLFHRRHHLKSTPEEEFIHAEMNVKAADEVMQSKREVTDASSYSAIVLPTASAGGNLHHMNRSSVGVSVVRQSVTAEVKEKTGIEKPEILITPD
ncbi:amino acid permease-domain-containing protein [Chytriomyces sp. MP71]|nr:amino acid permease-domain-containing protein [Chytriomyces sp. MP71]